MSADPTIYMFYTFLAQWEGAHLVCNFLPAATYVTSAKWCINTRSSMKVQFREGSPWAYQCPIYIFLLCSRNLRQNFSQALYRNIRFWGKFAGKDANDYYSVQAQARDNRLWGNNTEDMRSRNHYNKLGHILILSIHACLTWSASYDLRCVALRLSQWAFQLGFFCMQPVNYHVFSLLQAIKCDRTCPWGCRRVAKVCGWRRQSAQFLRLCSILETGRRCVRETIT